MISDKELVRKCLEQDPAAQELLYRRFASKMLGVCLRYARDRMEAEDILQDGFVKVFNKLVDFRGDGSLEGWVRRIMVNSAINAYHSNLKYLQNIEIENAKLGDSGLSDFNALDSISVEEMLKLVQELPEGYRIVFNMYAIEGYSHKEIGGMLNITESTSKSQLSRARVTLQKKLLKLNPLIYEKTA
ncbi:MAG: sigma-70 family RNA polymerase sigma factor [Bacteroidota bacterium]